MTFSRARRDAARALTGAILMWPLAHYPIVQAFEMSPWHFGGFAMYAAPRPALQSRDPLLSEKHGALRAVPVEQLPQSVRARVIGVLGDGLNRRAALGILYDPTPQADALFSLSPTAANVVMSIEQCELDVKAFVVCETLSYWCSRRAPTVTSCTSMATAPRAGDVIDAR